MMYLLQSLIIFAVCASNIRWQWTPNGYLASMLGGIAALLATVAVNGLLAWRQRLADSRCVRARCGTGHPTKRTCGPRSLQGLSSDGAAAPRCWRPEALLRRSSMSTLAETGRKDLSFI